MDKLHALTGDMLDDVTTFNERIVGLARPAAPQRLLAQRKLWALDALDEEVREYELATTIEDETDSLIDLIYFALGRLMEMGVPIRAAFGEVQRANMDKQRGELSKRPNSLGYDAIKPEGWSAPVYTDLLCEVTLEEMQTLAALRRGEIKVVTS